MKDWLVRLALIEFLIWLGRDLWPSFKPIITSKRTWLVVVYLVLLILVLMCLGKV